MSYTPTTWANGDIITATKLNNIESGVQSVSSSYTPTTWVNGDIITATKLNNIEQGIANAGGGGSSDFSTAQVTVINNTGHNNGLAIPTICEANELGEGSPAMIFNTMICPSGETTRRVCLYKGLAYCSGAFPSAISITTSGNITIDENDNVNITGDCTITIS